MNGPATPVTVLTGFLGAGKTTLLNRLLVRPELSRSAVVINEFGQTGIDHLLVEGAQGDLLVLTSGCICCAARGDLLDAMRGLLDRRRLGAVDFERIVIETTGLADPGPVLQAVICDDVMATACRPDAVLAVVDAVAGEATLAGQAEARHQVALADAVLMSKLDLRGPGGAAVAARLDETVRRLNPIAAVLDARDIGAVATALTLAHRTLPDGLLPSGFRAEPVDHGEPVAICLRAGRLDPGILQAFLDQVLARYGSAVLRLKGIVASANDPDKPLVVQGVGSLLYPAERLQAWPSPDRGTRIVLIVRDLPGSPIEELWAAFFGPPAIDRPDAAGLLAWHADAPGLF